MKKHELNQLNVVIKTEGLNLKGILGFPREPSGIVLFAHGSGSCRLSPRNNFVAGVLQKEDIATLLMDLLEESEEQDQTKVFDINLLANRLLAGTDWIKSASSDTAFLECGYFGASTGAAAALQAATEGPAYVKAVVSRGGRPDLAEEYLPLLRTPTLLIVGGEDKSGYTFEQAGLRYDEVRKRTPDHPGSNTSL